MRQTTPVFLVSGVPVRLADQAARWAAVSCIPPRLPPSRPVSLANSLAERASDLRHSGPPLSFS
jgi:hypothetical protein